MTDVQRLIRALLPEDLAALRQRGADLRLDRDMLDAIDRAVGVPGESRGYYGVRGSLEPSERRHYCLRADVTAAIFPPATLESRVWNASRNQ